MLFVLGLGSIYAQVESDFERFKRERQQEMNANSKKDSLFYEELNEEYQRYIEEVRDILKGDIKKLTSTIIAEMQREAENLNFEKAQILKERYQLIENFRTRSEVVSPTISNVDVFSIESDEKSAFVNFLHITNGCITQAFTIEYSKKLDESDEELISMGIIELRERFNSNAKEIILPFPIELPLEGITITIPQKGEKARLLALSKLNVKQYKADGPLTRLLMWIRPMPRRWRRAHAPYWSPPPSPGDSAPATSPTPKAI